MLRDIDFIQAAAIVACCMCVGVMYFIHIITKRNNNKN